MTKTYIRVCIVHRRWRWTGPHHRGTSRNRTQAVSTEPLPSRTVPELLSPTIFWRLMHWPEQKFRRADSRQDSIVAFERGWVLEFMVVTLAKIKTSFNNMQLILSTMLYYSYRLHNSWHKYSTRFPSLHVSAWWGHLQVHCSEVKRVVYLCHELYRRCNKSFSYTQCDAEVQLFLY
jgi:hypothetical protein